MVYKAQLSGGAWTKAKYLKSATSHRNTNNKNVDYKLGRLYPESKSKS